jgi:hypothetical protein
MAEPFTKNELIVISNGLDALVRNEGTALAQGGLALIQQSLGQLTVRFTCAVQANQKVLALIGELDAPPAPAPEPVAPPPAEPDAPPVHETETRGRATNGAKAAH